MHKLNLALVLLATMLCQAAFSQNMTATPSLGWSTFIQGVEGVDNEFTIPDDSYDKVILVFSGDNTDDTVEAVLNGSDWEATKDMGELEDDEVSVSLYAYDANDNEIASAVDYDKLILLPEPTWLSDDFDGEITVTGIDATNNIISFDAELPLKSVFDSIIPNSIKGLRGKTVSFTAKLKFSGEYDADSHTTNCPDNPEVVAQLSFVNGEEELTIPLTTDVDMEDDFNPILTVSSVQDFPGFQRSLAITKIPIVGPVCLSVDAGFSVTPKLKGQVVIGMDGNGDWGFIEDGGESTSLLGKINAKASVNGSVQALCGIKRSSIAKGSLGIEANIGSGTTYTDEDGKSTIFGGDFRVYGSIKFPWPFRKLSITDKTLYGAIEFGDTAGLSFKVASSTDDFFGSSSSTSRSVETDDVPESFPFGTVASLDSNLVIVWIDDINADGGTSDENSKIELSYYDHSTNSLSEPITIEDNDHGMHNLSAALLPNGNTLLAWVQSRYANKDIDTTLDFNELLSSEDIWIAVYNPTTEKLVYKSRIADDSTQVNSGRSEGNPKLVWNKKSKTGLVVWEVADNIGSDIYSAVIQESIQGNYSVDGPITATLTNPGQHYSPQVVFVDTTSDKAMLTWLYDFDANDSTNNTIVYQSIWDGFNWSTPTIGYALPAGTSAKEISLTSNGSFGIKAITYEGYQNSCETLVNGVAIGTWGNNNPASITYIIEEDSQYYYQLPKTSISSTGIASAIIQVRDVEDAEDEGNLEMYLKDVRAGGSWTEISENSEASSLQYINDTLNTVWEMNNAFGYYSDNGGKDLMYLLTQEADTSGETNVTYGSRLGEPDLHMVLRAFEVDRTGGVISLLDVEEPEDSAIYFYSSIQDIDQAIGFELSQNAPNPFSEHTQMKFRLEGKATIQLQVFNNIGQSIATLISKQEFQSGDYTTDFNSGNLPQGMYHYQLTVNNKTVTKHMVIIK